MSKPLSDERQHALDAAHKFKKDAELIWLSLLKPYCNALAQTDKSFVEWICREYKPGVAFIVLTTSLQMFDHVANSDLFADVEAKFIAFAGEFDGATREMLFELQRHAEQYHPAIYAHMPDAENQRREISRLIDDRLNRARELSTIRAERVKRAENNQLADRIMQRPQQVHRAKDDGTLQTQTELPAEFGLPKDKAFFNGKEIFRAASESARAVGIARGVSRTRVFDQLSKFEDRDRSARTKQTYNLSRDDAIEFLREFFER